MDITVSSRLAEAKLFLQNNPGLIVADIETTSLTIGKGRILCMAFAPLDSEEIFVWWPRDLAQLQSLRLPKAVFHNAPFDQPWLESYGAKVRTVWDTMLMAHLLDENHPIGLDDLGHRLLGYGKDKIDIKNLEDEDPDKVSMYVAKDVHIGRELLRWQRSHIRRNLKPGEDPVRVMRKILLPAIAPLKQMENNRLPVRTVAVRKRKKVVEARIAEIEQKLDASIPPKEEWPEWLQKTTPKWGATNWTKWWLYEYQGAPVPRRTKPTKTWPEGNPGLAQEDLDKLSHPAAKLLSERSTLYKQLTGFLVPLEERTRDGRIATSFSLTGTVTGRLSSKNPGADNPGLNSQQIPRDRATRNLFGEKGQAWIEVDFSQLELRVAAVMSGDPEMLRLFREGEDIHTYMAHKLVRGGPITKEHRSLAKGVNFGFLYGMHSKHFADYVRENYGVTITKVEAEAFRKEYFDTFAALPDWYRRQRQFAIEHGGVYNEFGRFRHLPRVYNDDYWVQENAFRQAINAPVQSTGSDFMLISLGHLARDLRLPRLGARLITTVHDSVCLTAPYRTARQVGRIVKETMEKADDSLTRKFFLKADVTISRCWGGEPLAEF